MKASSWKDSLKASAKDALATIARQQSEEARKLIVALERAGHTVRLTPTGDGLLVSNPPVADDLAEKIRRLKPDLIEALKASCAVWGWVPDYVCVKCSLSQSSITDFVLAPPVEGVGHTEIKPGIQNVLLEGAGPEWRARVKWLGGLVAYSLSQWEQAKPLLAAKLEALDGKQLSA